MKALFFDLDNTLYDYDAAHASGFQALAAHAQRNFGLPEDRFSALHREAMRIQQDRAGTNCAAIHNRLIRYQILLEQLGQPVSRAPELSGVYWSAFLDGVQPYPGAKETIAFAKERGCKVGVGTNMTADYQYEKLARLGLLELMDSIVTSEEAGAEKPDARLFRLCVKKAGCLPGECVFVGDSLTHDVQGAARAGLRAVWFCRGAGESVPGQGRVRSLEELPELLKTF